MSAFGRAEHTSEDIPMKAEALKRKCEAVSDVLIDAEHHEVQKINWKTG